MKGQPYNLCEPANRQALHELRETVEQYCATHTLIAPLSREELESHAMRLLEGQRLSPALIDFARVLIGNAAWRDAVAATPYNRRILLLPQCLRSSKACKGEFDALGLLCAECGQCSIGRIQREADRLGYAVLVAEGTTAVTTLLSRGEADAIVGVSCLHALEQSFGPLTANAIPSLAVPLLRNECRDTETDIDWLLALLALRDESRQSTRMDLPGLRRDVEGWFEAGALRELLCRGASETERLAVDWLTRAGKRWRPLLAAGVYRALSPEASPATASLRHLAVAAECFHKASLIHDDIEDEDDTRYGEQTLHREHGVAIALNIGDLLIGEGYRLIAEAGLPADLACAMIRTAAEGHRTLCLGQGAELLQARSSVPGVDEVINIFRQKTAPAFDVALQLGAIAAGSDTDVRHVLTAFSNAMGIAYQIQDDIDDHTLDRPATNGARHAVSLIDALAHERFPASPDEAQQGNIMDRARALRQHCANETLRALVPLRQPMLKGLLFRIANLLLSPSRP